MNLKKALRQRCMLDPQYAQSIIDKYDKDSESQGWCRLVSLKPTKRNGYIQLSWKGANKFAVMQQVVLWATGRQARAGEDASHLCHQKQCVNGDHVIPEAKQLNQVRKGCRVWVDCNHCERKIFLCCHEPPCIKYCAGFRDHHHFMNNGICKKVVDEPALDN
ncbi:zinc-binding loop region of homing endonuclease-domain-containing protein [Penicillium verrucosum]|uniref:zinc-binding loop region of homing endonuclease-domain-containing protein n=1 Tax=Penicillium verrucosum TaxID=60171 RepID=UPI0025458E08|nr:zinc-binding loop region of homing endonuclease-domain-containing protein [Penicillium verrucosum]KAJ5933305.1 zinc-binding loop region of homing endonuclease-domain-containing protein [Penicillium verrucosum]